MPPASSIPPPSNPYLNTELFRFVGSMEGVPDWIDPAEAPGERAGHGRWQRRGYALLEISGQLAPGVGLALLLAAIGGVGSGLLGTRVFGLEQSPVSPILLAILLGLLVRNVIGLPRVYESGLALCLRRVLRIGVALLGIRLSVGAVGSIGLAALPLIALCIAAALLVVGRVSVAAGLPRRLGTLVAVGTAICGNTAIVATAPVIGASEDETSYAVGTITVFGLIALLLHPFLAHALFAGDPLRAGLFLGTAIHDTAQVAGAGLLYAQQYQAAGALEAATVTKLVRNLFMVVVIPLVALLHHRGAGARPGQLRPPLATLVPLFVLGFLAMALLRTLGDLGAAPFGGLLTHEAWAGVIAFVSKLSTLCLTVAMASVGLGTHLARLRKLGLRPLAVGLFAAVAVGAASALMLLAARGLFVEVI